MAKKKMQNVRNSGRVSAEQLARDQEVRRRVMQKYPPKRKTAAAVELKDVMSALKEVRAAKGLTLAEITRSTGIATPNLSNLENATDANPTVQTLLRYADAVGKTIHIVLEDVR